MAQIFRPSHSWESQVAKRLQEFSTRTNSGQKLPLHIDDSKLVYTRLKALAKQIRSFVTNLNVSVVSSGKQPINPDDIINELERALQTRSPYTDCVCIERYRLLYLAVIPFQCFGFNFVIVRG